MLYILTFITIVFLIFVNGFTDAPNAITTVVSTNVLKFRKAAFISAIFNLLGIILMSLINFRVANGISNIIILENGKLGIIALLSGILACIVFSCIASIFGIPTSETHGLIAGLVGSATTLKNINNINVYECLNVVLGLILSVIGSIVVTKITYKLLKNILYKINSQKIKTWQKFALYCISFMHGAQDGQKFIGLVILYMSIVKGSYMVQNSAIQNIWIIIFVAIVMCIGVAIGGRKIVENVGKNTVELDNVKGIVSDIGTAINLFIASILGFPVSTTHVKTMSIISLGDSIQNKKYINDIYKAWIWTFPFCFALGYFISKILMKIT